MHFIHSSAIAGALLYGITQVQANDVFAHFMVCLVEYQLLLGA